MYEGGRDCRKKTAGMNNDIAAGIDGPHHRFYAGIGEMASREDFNWHTGQDGKGKRELRPTGKSATRSARGRRSAGVVRRLVAEAEQCDVLATVGEITGHDQTTSIIQRKLKEHHGYRYNYDLPPVDEGVDTDIEETPLFVDNGRPVTLVARNLSKHFTHKGGSLRPSMRSALPLPNNNLSRSWVPAA